MLLKGPTPTPEYRPSPTLPARCARCTNRNTKRTHPTPRRKEKGNRNHGEHRCRKDKGKTYLSTPAAAISSTHWAGCDTIRWASSKAFVCFRKPLMTCDAPRNKTHISGGMQIWCFGRKSVAVRSTVAISANYQYGLRRARCRGSSDAGGAWHSRFAVERKTACVGCAYKNNTCIFSLL